MGHKKLAYSKLRTLLSPGHSLKYQKVFLDIRHAAQSLLKGNNQMIKIKGNFAVLGKFVRM
jgi:hypothetical protein